jgi:tetratricopeptide (TPR) repeat protein
MAMERRFSQENPVDLIDGGQFLTAEEMFSERRTDDPMEMVIRSEVAMYFDRREDGARLLEQVAPRIVDIDVAARFSLAKGRLAFWQGDNEQASAQFETAYHFYLFQNDSFGIGQALLGLAHLARRRGELQDAVAKLAAAQENIKGRVSKKVEFLRGLILAEQAALNKDLGEIEQAVDCYAESSRMLKNTERGRFYARVLMGTADLKCALGDFQDSLELYKEANTTFERYDIKEDLARCQLKLAEALIRLKRYERAERLAEESRELRRGDPKGESAALTLLAQVALQQNELDEASTRAAAAVEMADESGVAEIRAQARVALGHVKLAEHEFKQAAEA